MMTTSDDLFQRALCKVLTEIFDGPPGDEAYLLNPGYPGLLRQLDSVDAEAASSRPMPGQVAAKSEFLVVGLTERLRLLY